MTEEDKSLFLSAVNDVFPLKKGNKVALHHSKTVKQRAKQTIKEVKNKQRMSTDATKTTLNTQEYRVPLMTSQERMLYHQKGIRLQELSKLKKGDFINQAQLDLHGYTCEEAQFALFNFIENALQNKRRYIRVIHGKGYNSEERFPVLKNLVNQSLREFNHVLAFCSAPEKDGGAGAVNIFLKKTYIGDPKD